MPDTATLQRPTADTDPTALHRMLADRHAGTSVPAVLSFIFSMLWLGGVGSIIGIVLGTVGRHEVDDTDGRYSGHGLATAGVWLGWVGLAAPVVIILALLAGMTS